jgi:hypothetical protein
MMTFDAHGCVAARYYLDVFPTLDGSKPLGTVAARTPALPAVACRSLSGPGGTPELQPGAAAGAGLPVAGASQPVASRRARRPAHHRSSANK